MEPTKSCRVVLFSGGSASNLLARSLDQRGVDLVNVVTVFDNGGSTGALRRITPIPAMGDIRNRLLTLARPDSPLHQAAKKLFELRFSERKAEKQLKDELDSLASGFHPLMCQVPGPSRSDLLETLNAGISALPHGFSLRELSLGNLLLFGYALRAKDFMSAVEWCRQLLNVRPYVYPVTLDSVHLGAICDNGSWVLGQATLTNENLSLPGRVRDIRLLAQENSFAFQSRAKICPALVPWLDTADIFVIGFGSFLTSILPHFLVKGVGSAFARRRIPKLFLCNPTADKESVHSTVGAMITTLDSYAVADLEKTEPDGPIITHILHFGSNAQTRIPRGDLSLSGYRGEYMDLHEVAGFHRMANRASEFVFSLIGFSPLEPSTHLQSGGIDSVVLFDLDATLFDYKEIRMNATVAALDGLVNDPTGIASELLDLLRPPFTELLVNLGLPDLRREWDAPEVFAVACLLDKSSTRRHLLEVVRHSKALPLSEDYLSFSDRIQTYRFAVGLQRLHSIEATLQAIYQVNREPKDSVQAAVERFRRHVEEYANLVPGARDIIDYLISSATEVHVVSEGDTTIQTFKFQSLKLVDLVKTCIVTDMTCGVQPLLAELFVLHRNDMEVPSSVAKLFDQLSPYTIKSTSFFSKLLHGLVDTNEANLQQRIASVRFLTPEEWNGCGPRQVIMVGDRYRKDIEPLLQVCSRGVYTYRLSTGPYYAEDPLHLLMEQHRPLPNAVFRDLASVGPALFGATKEAREAIKRPLPALPDPELIDDVLSGSNLSHQSQQLLGEIRCEANRHKDNYKP